MPFHHKFLARDPELDYSLGHNYMIFHDPFLYAFWLATVVLEAGILVALFARGLYRQYPRFTAYILLQFVADVFLMCAQSRWPYAYYFGYWGVTAVSVMLTVAILYEILQQMLRPLDLGKKIAAALVRWITILALTLSPLVLLALIWGGSVPDVVTGFILGVDRDLRILVFAGGIGILMLGRRLGVSQREFVVGIVSGFVLSSYVRIMVASLMAHRIFFYPFLYRSTLSVIDLAGCALAELIWLGYALRSPKLILGGTGPTPLPLSSGPASFLATDH